MFPLRYQMITSVWAVVTSVINTNNGPSQDYPHPNEQTTRNVTKCYSRVQNIYGIYSVRWLKATLPWLTSSFHWKRELFHVSAPVLRLSRKFGDLALLAQLVPKNNSTCTKFTHSTLIQIQNSSPTCPRSHDLRTWHKFLGDCRF